MSREALNAFVGAEEGCVRCVAWREKYELYVDHHHHIIVHVNDHGGKITL